MQGTSVVFGERVVLLDDRGPRLPGPLLLPGDHGISVQVRHRPGRIGQCTTADRVRRGGHRRHLGDEDAVYAQAGQDAIGDRCLGDGNRRDLYDRADARRVQPGGDGAGWCAHDGFCETTPDGAAHRRRGGVYLPGPGPTVADRVAGAVDPAAERNRTDAAARIGARLTEQDEVDIAVAGRLCPTDADEVRRAAAVLDLGAWRYRMTHCAPGPGLAAALEQRPEQLKPASGTGPVVYPDPITGELPDPGMPARFPGVVSPGRAVPIDPEWPRAVLDGIVARQRLIAHLQATQYADIAELSGCYDGIHQYLTTELALALHTTDSEAAAMLGVAEALRDRLPDTAAALSAGRIDETKAIALTRATAHCTPEITRAVEQAVLPDAETITPAAVRRRAGRAVISADPDGAADRHRRARTDRHVWRAPETDGMARLGIYAPAQDVATIWQAITGVADAIRRPGDQRTLGERRADALSMICTDIMNGGGWHGLRLSDTGRGRARINVTVPYSVLLGHRAPCELRGYGPICTEQALPLIGAGDMYRMLCDPESGQLLDYGHTRYRPPPHLAEFVRARDGECPMPCCHHPADRGAIDHIVPAKPDPVTGKPTLGTTCADNLAPPCPHHHNSKDAGRGFHLHRAIDGTYTWTTPLGHTYTWRPDPHWHADTDALPTDHNHGQAPGTPAHNPGPAPGTPARNPGPACGGRGRDDDLTMPGTGRTDIPVCDCPPTCGCQHGPDADPHDRLVPLTVDEDWADGYAWRAEDGTPEKPPRSAPVATASTGATHPPAHPATDGTPGRATHRPGHVSSEQSIGSTPPGADSASAADPDPGATGTGDPDWDSDPPPF